MSTDGAQAAYAEMRAVWERREKCRRQLVVAEADHAVAHDRWSAAKRGDRVTPGRPSVSHRPGRDFLPVTPRLVAAQEAREAAAATVIALQEQLVSAKTAYVELVDELSAATREAEQLLPALDVVIEGRSYRFRLLRLEEDAVYARWLDPHERHIFTRTGTRWRVTDPRRGSRSGWNYGQRPRQSVLVDEWRIGEAIREYDRRRSEEVTSG